MPTVLSRVKPATLLAACAAAALFVACAREPAPLPATTGAVRSASAHGSDSAAPRPTSSSADSRAAPPAPSPLDEALAGARWGAVARSLSEKPGDFPSDNLISNETSLLQPAAALSSRAPGGTYIGVGPEQNFTYVALGRPELAVIIDIRRDNLLMHALYRAFFSKGDDRTAFACQLFARPCEGAATSGEPDAILRHAAKAPFDAKSFEEVHARVAELVGTWGLELDTADRRRMRALHEQIAKAGPDLRFEMRQPSGRAYPTLVGLLSAPAAAAGEPRSFFATDAAYLVVRDLQRKGRIVPVVGDFAGADAVKKAGELSRKFALEVRTFYVSNVEQYLLADKKWGAWVDNVKSLPLSADAVLVRGYLDQGKRHPREWKGHRTATVVQPAKLLVERGRDKPYPSFFDAAIDGLGK